MLREFKIGDKVYVNDEKDAKELQSFMKQFNHQNGVIKQILGTERTPLAYMLTFDDLALQEKNNDYYFHVEFVHPIEEKKCNCITCSCKKEENSVLKYKEGDRVILRKDLEPDKYYGNDLWVDGMESLTHTPVTIDTCLPNIGKYKIKGSWYSITDEMIECLEKEQKERNEKDESVDTTKTFADLFAEFMPDTIPGGNVTEEERKGMYVAYKRSDMSDLFGCGNLFGILYACSTSQKDLVNFAVDKLGVEEAKNILSCKLTAFEKTTGRNIPTDKLLNINKL